MFNLLGLCANCLILYVNFMKNFSLDKLAVHFEYLWHSDHNDVIRFAIGHVLGSIPYHFSRFVYQFLDGFSFGKLIVHFSY
ncbi:hypothetical protein KFK09_014950 [Dendrobium nobile]|uniref:Uncharacterized protein n=1 Tax=Dendrobium nobile TaxID=94219 RepID=A0A8T3B5U2_DENNO|nr:hypothetical protein KFK09_014950 [Dendrobium nobile]